jgi:flagella basal body P-ring formation protein FlgA
MIWRANCRQSTHMQRATINRRHAFHRLRAGLICLLVSATALAGSEPTIESVAAIRAAAEAFIRAQLPGDASSATVTADHLDGRLRFARCQGVLRAALPTGAVLQARTTVGVSCDTGAAWTVYVPVTTQSRINILVLRHPVARDARLSAEDVEVQKRELSGTGVAFLNSLTDLRGRTVKRPLPTGTALSIDMFTADVLVRQGQQVTLVATVGGLQVRATGKALSNGSAGARLRVQNLSSLRVVEGVVENEDVIRVVP